MTTTGKVDDAMRMNPTATAWIYLFLQLRPTDRQPFRGLYRDAISVIQNCSGASAGRYPSERLICGAVTDRLKREFILPNLGLGRVFFCDTLTRATEDAEDELVRLLCLSCRHVVKSDHTTLEDEWPTVVMRAMQDVCTHAIGNLAERAGWRRGYDRSCWSRILQRTDDHEGVVTYYVVSLSYELVRPTPNPEAAGFLDSPKVGKVYGIAPGIVWEQKCGLVQRIDQECSEISEEDENDEQ